MWRGGLRTLGLVLALATPAWAQFAVEDVVVGAQTALTAINTARQIVQQGTQIANEAQMIQNQIEELAYAAANLTKSPLQLNDTLQGLLGQYEGMLRRAGGLGFHVESLEGRLGTVYPVFGQPVQDVQGGLQQVEAWLGEIRNASMTAMTAQAITNRLQAQRASLNLALLQSDAAPGHLAAIQDGNQILGIIVEQNASMQQITAASARARTAMDLGQAALADQAVQEAAQHVSGLGAMEEVKSIGIPAFR